MSTPSPPKHADDPAPPIYADDPELEELRHALRAFEAQLERAREALEHHKAEARRLDTELEEMIHNHDARQSRHAKKEGLTRRIVEDVNFDFAMLGHALQRWIFRNDSGS